MHNADGRFMSIGRFVPYDDVLQWGPRYQETYTVASDRAFLSDHPFLSAVTHIHNRGQESHVIQEGVNSAASQGRLKLEFGPDGKPRPMELPAAPGPWKRR